MALSRPGEPSSQSIENPVYTSLGENIVDPFTAESDAIKNSPLPLVAAPALAATSVSLLPTPPAQTHTTSPWDEIDTAKVKDNATGPPSPQDPTSELLSSTCTPPTPQAQDTADSLTSSNSPNDGQDKEVNEENIMPFNLSEYGLVHLPPLPSSRSNSEQCSSPKPGGSDKFYSVSSRISPSASSQSSSYNGELSKRLRRQIGGLKSNVGSDPASSRSRKAGTSDSSRISNSGSDNSQGPLVTLQFKHVEDVDGHHVIVGREGQLQRCEDEPIHTPGSVQGYGVLIAVQDIDGTLLLVRQVSENSTELLGMPPNYLFSLDCFTDALPDEQVDAFWDNINFLLEPGHNLDEDNNSPHVFLLSGWGAPGSASPDDPGARDGRRVWSCWCAVHRSENLGSDAPGPIVIELELEKDRLNPLYPLVPEQIPQSRPTNATDTTRPPPPGRASPSDSISDGSTRVGSASETTAPSPMPTDASGSNTLWGLEGDDEWTPEPGAILESTTSFSKPIPALERLRHMSRSGVSSMPNEDTTEGSRAQRRARRQNGRGSAAVGMMDVFAVMTQINDQLGAATELEMFLKVVVGVIKDLTQFHRIMVYQFDESWNGQVVAELVDWNMSHDLFMGLHFPAADIPAQARDLYAINKVRLLYDRSQPTARIVCRSKEDLDTPLNMTHSYLRAMSPIHIQYLENMGVRASMSISILSFGQLWGLVTCHSYGAHGMRVSFPVRQMLRLLSQSISKNIERLSYAQRLHTRKLVNTLTSNTHPTGYIVSNADDLLGLFDADFGILVIGEGAKILGPNQNGQEILIMAEYLRLKQFNTIQASQAVANDYPDLRLTTGLEVIAGLLYVPLSRDGRDFIAFLRRGQPRHVNWAGKPFKDKVEGSLEPRKSFKMWSETVAGRCRTWTDEQLETAGVLALVYGKFIEVWRQKESALETTKLTNLLLSNASHEVRTPLNHIINYLEMAMNGSLDGETRENLKRSHAASKGLLFTINDLLDLTRLESGNETSFNEPFHLRQAIEEATAVYRREAGRRGLEFKLEVDEVPMYVIGDSKKMCTVVQNLIANALKYTSKGSIKVQCSTYGEPEGLRRENQMVIQIVVADTGCGIEPAKLESIFREFEQVESTEGKGEPAGVGLGLAVVARIVEQLGGQLRVDSVVGDGSRFSFLIPLSLCEKEGQEDPGNDSVSDSGDSSKVSLHSSMRSGGSEIDELVEALSSSPLASSVPGGTSETGGTESFRGSYLLPSSHPIRPVKVDPFADKERDAADGAALRTPSAKNESSTPGFFLTRSPSAPKAEPRGPPTPTGLRVLIVEDNEINRFILGKRLTMSGHTVVNTTNGQEGVEMIESDQAFDIVFMDIQMPILDGFQATQRIREAEERLKTSRSAPSPRHSQKQNGRIPIFAVSASLRESQREELMRYGMDGWILKPVDFKRLKIIMQGILDPIQRDKDIYQPGCNWESGGWLGPPIAGELDSTGCLTPAA